jgi:hypothetical protein
MMGALVALLSLGMTQRLVQAGQIARTLIITAATATTPIVITSAAHGIPPARVAHAVVSGVGGMPEADGGWVLTPVDANTLTLTGFDQQGNAGPSVGAGTYTTGGIAQIAFPDLQILLGRQMLGLASAVASPRVVMIPTDGKAWGLSPDGGAPTVPTTPPTIGNAQDQAIDLTPQLATQYTTFEVYITGALAKPQPNFGDLDATQALVWTFYSVLFDMLTPARALVLHESWPSQSDKAGSMTQRGQQWKGIVQIEQGVRGVPWTYVPANTSMVLTIGPLAGGSADQTIIVIPAS